MSTSPNKSFWYQILFFSLLIFAIGCNSEGDEDPNRPLASLEIRNQSYGAYADETDPLSPLEIDPLELIGFLGQKSGSSSGLI